MGAYLDNVLRRRTSSDFSLCDLAKIETRAVSDRPLIATMTTSNNNYRNTVWAPRPVPLAVVLAREIDDDNKNYKDECYDEALWAQAWLRARDFYIDQGVDWRRREQVQALLPEHPDIIQEVMDSNPTKEEFDEVGYSLVGRALLRVAKIDEEAQLSAQV